MIDSIPTVESYGPKPELKEKYLAQIQENSVWSPKGIQAHLLLLHPQGIASLGGVAAVNPIGYRWGIATYIDQYMRWSYDPRDFARIGAMIAQHNASGDGWMQSYRQQFTNATKIFSKRAVEIYLHFHPRTLQEVRQALIEIINLGIIPQSYGFITEAWTSTQGSWVDRYLQRLAPDITSEDKNFLLQPLEPSFVKQFELRVATARSDKDWEAILDDFYWVKGSYFMLPTLDRDQLEKEQAAMAFDPLVRRRQKDAVLEKYDASEELKRFVSMTEDFVLMQDERKANVLRLNYAIKKIVEEALRFKPGWTFEELLSLTPQEFVAWCEGSLSEEIKNECVQRNHRSAWIFAPDGYLITTDPDLFDTIASLFHSAPTSVIQGVCASRGTVEGIARIVLSEKDFSKVQVGDILVTSMTRPEFMPVLKKAAAFVTDEGGITSHAAIVSREMNKPCVIGTRVATQVLKDGDRIEVDATEGIIKRRSESKEASPRKT
jgi:phosphohistidine swiveling domain-containing protein